MRDVDEWVNEGCRMSVISNILLHTRYTSTYTHTHSSLSSCTTYYMQLWTTVAATTAVAAATAIIIINNCNRCAILCRHIIFNKLRHPSGPEFRLSRAFFSDFLFSFHLLLIVFSVAFTSTHSYSRRIPSTHTLYCFDWVICFDIFDYMTRVKYEHFQRPKAQRS